MSLQINLEVDWTEVDGAINRLITAIQPKHVHNLSAKTAYRQVKTKYPERWRSQVNTDSIWQQVKQEIQGQVQSDSIGALLRVLAVAPLRLYDTAIRSNRGQFPLRQSHSGFECAYLRIRKG